MATEQTHAPASSAEEAHRGNRAGPPEVRAGGEERLRIGSLCTGIAALDLGIAGAVRGARLAWVAESDPDLDPFFATRFPAAPNLGDITTVDWGRVEPVEVLSVGFPCTDVSVSGRGAGIEEGTRSGLWSRALEAVRRLRPGLVVVENVAALRSRGLGRLLGDLARVGYDARWTSLRACDVGAPHARARLFALAYPHGARRGPGPLLGGAAAPAGETGVPARPAPGAHREQLGGAWVQEELFSPAREPEPLHIGTPAAQAPCPLNSKSDTWGRYERAIRRWECVTGQQAPCPLEPGARGGRRLNPAFSEWAMGLPAGWVTDLGVSRAAQLRALGNAVVPQQAETALQLLLEGDQWNL